MDEIPIKALIFDVDEPSVQALTQALREIDIVLSVDSCKTESDAFAALKRLDINVMYIAPVGLGIDRAEDFIRLTRTRHPSVVFVLYYEKSRENNLYTVMSRRFQHYFKLEKSMPGPSFTQRVSETVSACQGDLSYNLTQEKIASLQNELVGIQEAASNDTATVPLTILQDIQDQLTVLKEERKSAGPFHSAAAFLGSIAASVEQNKCFIIMPYSQEWSEAVETILKEVCEAANFEFIIAKEMEGRFIPHDIWKGISGSALMIADLTGANANVAYEVGLADALGREVILICQETNVPFDFLAQRLIVYKNTVQGAIDLRRKLSEKLKSVNRTID